MDKLASQGMRFEWAHVNVSVCQPSRSVLLTGRYSHRCGGEGFSQLRIEGVPLLPEVLRESGYRVGAMGKLKHSTPYADFRWDFSVQRAELGMGRNPRLYRENAQRFIEESVEQGAPFFLMANSHDPHRPFFGFDPESWYTRGELSASRPSSTWGPGECPSPGFLPQLAMIGQEVAGYFSSVRRCDDTVGALLEALEETGVAGSTIVIFISDNGMAFPFSKAACYLSSTRTPWIVRWPGVVVPGTVCSEEMISAVDLMPSLLEATASELPEGLDGRSILPLLEGERQSGREYVFTQFGAGSSGESFPMRCVQSRRYGYVFNLWADGERRFTREEHKINGAFQAMVNAANHVPEIASRTEFLMHRCPEELYDLEADPDALNNLIDDPAYTEELSKMRSVIENWMDEYEDPSLPAFRSRGERAESERYMRELENAFGQ